MVADGAIAKPTKEEWANVERELRSSYGRVLLQVDAYRLTLQVQPLKNLQFAIFVFVDGVWRGKWIIEDCEERRRFCQRGERHLFPRKIRADFERRFGKRALARSTLDRKFITWQPWWRNARSLIRHLCANNAQIRVLGVGALQCYQQRDRNPTDGPAAEKAA